MKYLLIGLTIAVLFLFMLWILPNASDPPKPKKCVFNCEKGINQLQSYMNELYPTHEIHVKDYNDVSIDQSKDYASTDHVVCEYEIAKLPKDPEVAKRVKIRPTTKRVHWINDNCKFTPEIMDSDTNENIEKRITH